MAILLEKLFKWIFIGCLVLMAVAFFRKDDFPNPDFYDVQSLKEPIQQAIKKKPFATVVEEYTYEVIPRYDYELNGVVVSYHDADSITDSVHERVWKDYLNLRDLCVVWDKNISSGVYLDLDYSNDSWTCWYSWADRETGRRFKADQLSNNHLLADDPYINDLIMSAEVGDQIRFKGFLAEYKNRSNGFHRGTSTVRTDTGNGACETVYVTDFDIVKKANAGWRKVYQVAKIAAIISLIGFIVMLVIAPVRMR